MEVQNCSKFDIGDKVYTYDKDNYTFGTVIDVRYDDKYKVFWYSISTEDGCVEEFIAEYELSKDVREESEEEWFFL